MTRLPILSLTLALGLSAPAPVATAAPVPAGPTDEQLKEQILTLNDLTTINAMEAKRAEISKDADKAKRLAKFAAKMQAVPGKPPLKFNAALVMAYVARGQRDAASAEALYGWCLDQAYKTKSAERMRMTLPGYVTALNDRKKYAEAEEAAQRVLDLQSLGDGNEAQQDLGVLKLRAMDYLIRAKAQQGEINAALDRVDQLMALDKDGVGFHDLKAFVLREARRYDDVVATYQDMLKRVEKSDNFPAEVKERLSRSIRYMMTAALVDANKVDKSIALLRELVKEDPENPTYANDLGFILADNNKELDEAEKLIRKALKLDEEERKKPAPKADDEDAVPAAKAEGPNAAYLDSLGWVLFKKGKYEEALKHLVQAASEPGDGSHLEIWDHVADTQLALGKTQAAVDTWEKALKLDDVSPRDAERRKAVKAKLQKAKTNPPVAKDADKE